MEGVRSRNFVAAFYFLYIQHHYATSRKVAGSSPDEVDFFQLT
jgi:hypothetical protein